LLQAVAQRPYVPVSDIAAVEQATRRATFAFRRRNTCFVEAYAIILSIGAQFFVSEKASNLANSCSRSDVVGGKKYYCYAVECFFRYAEKSELRYYCTIHKVTVT